jgi:hypothetical protein
MSTGMDAKTIVEMAMSDPMDVQSANTPEVINKALASVVSTNEQALGEIKQQVTHHVELEKAFEERGVEMDTAAAFGEEEKFMGRIKKADEHYEQADEHNKASHKLKQEDEPNALGNIDVAQRAFSATPKI